MNLRRFPTAVIAIILLLTTATAGRAEVKQADSSLLGTRTEGVLGSLTTLGNDPPAVLPSDRDIYLLIFAGANYTDVEAIAKPNVGGPRLARALEASTRSTNLAGSTVEWSSDAYTLAEVQQGRYGLRTHASNTVPVATLMAGLTSAGFRVHPLIRVPKYATVTPSSALVYSGRFHWYAGPKLTANGPLRISTSLASWLVYVCLFLVLLMPAIPIVMFLTAERRAKRTLAQDDVDIEAVRAEFQRKTIFAPVIVSMPVMLAPLALIFSGYSRILADIWMGSPDSSVVAMFPILGFFTMIPCIVAAAKRSRKLFGKSALEHNLAAAREAMSPEERKLTKRSALATGLPHLLIIAPLFAGSFLIHGAFGRQLHSFAAPLAALIGMPLATLYNRRIKAITQSPANDELTWRAQQLAMHFGARVHAVRIDAGGKGKTRGFVNREGHDFVISEKMLMTSTPAEIDFLIATTLAKPKVRQGRHALFLLLPFVVTAPMFFVFFHRTWMAQTWFPLVAVSPILVMFPAMIYMSTRGQRKIQVSYTESAIAGDLKALEVTRDPWAAVAALEKVGADAVVISAGLGSTKSNDPLNPQVQWRERASRMRQLAESTVGMARSMR